MRKLLSVFILLSALTVPAFSYDHPLVAGNIEQSNGTAADGVRVYRLVRNPICPPLATVQTGIMNSSDAVLWDLVSDDGVSVNYPSRLGISTSSDAIAGILVTSIPSAEGINSASNDLGRRNWGYIQIYGKCYASFDALGGGAVVGQGFRASILDGNVVNAHSNGAGGGFGFAYDTSSGGGDTEVFVRAR